MSNPETRVHIIGVGGDGLAGLTSRGRDILLSAEFVFGPESVLELLPELSARHQVLGGDLQEATSRIAAVMGRRRVAVVRRTHDVVSVRARATEGQAPSLRAGERVVTGGAVFLKDALADLPAAKPPDTR